MSSGSTTCLIRVYFIEICARDSAHDEEPQEMGCCCCETHNAHALRTPKHATTFTTALTSSAKPTAIITAALAAAIAAAAIAAASVTATTFTSSVASTSIASGGGAPTTTRRPTQYV